MSRLYTALLAGACLAAIVTGCGPNAGPGGAPQTVEGTPVQDGGSIVELPARWATANARDVRTLVQTTDAVFVGEVTALSGQREELLGADAPGADAVGDDAGKPRARPPALFPISVFEVHVQRSLAGPLVEGSTVVMEQPGGRTTRSDGSQVTLVLEGDEPLEIGARYLFFASAKTGGALSSAPFARFTIAVDGSIVPPDAWADLPAAQQLADLKVEEAATEVQAVAD